MPDSNSPQMCSCMRGSECVIALCKLFVSSLCKLFVSSLCELSL